LPQTTQTFWYPVGTLAAFGAAAFGAGLEQASAMCLFVWYLAFAYLRFFSSTHARQQHLALADRASNFVPHITHVFGQVRGPVFAFAFSGPVPAAAPATAEGFTTATAVRTTGWIAAASGYIAPSASSNRWIASATSR
jgi:hypothetical protein